ncbi:hypothetical protein XENTR_v10016794 [Xenopus tropicalis]|nr:hypothetical protein XENTR_v10016794 [Xenopus tropicalis]
MMSTLHIVLWIILLELYLLCYHAISAVAKEEESQISNNEYYDESQQVENAQATNKAEEQNYDEPKNLTPWGEAQVPRELEIREAIYGVSIIILFILSAIGATGWLLFLHLLGRRKPIFAFKTLERGDEQSESELPPTKSKVHFEDEIKPEPKKVLSEKKKQAAPREVTDKLSLESLTHIKCSQIQFYKWKEKTYSEKEDIVSGKEDMPPLTTITPWLTIYQHKG